MAEDGNAHVVDISGLAKEWDSFPELRGMLRESGSIVKSEPGKYHPTDSINGVAVNFVMLSPIMPKLHLPGLDENHRARIGMVSIPALEDELLSSCLSLQCLLSGPHSPISKTKGTGKTLRI